MEENPIYVYQGGSFSPPTNAHGIMVFNTIIHLLEINSDTLINSIEYYVVPVSDLYQKSSVNSNFVSFTNRMDMLKIMVENIILMLTKHLQIVNINENTVNLIFNNKEYKIKIFVSNLEQTVSRNKGKYTGTYEYLLEFEKGKNISNIYLVFGADNILSLITNNSNKRWISAIHLILKYKFIVITRSGYLLDNLELINNFNNLLINLDLTTHTELNTITNSNNLEDISDQLEIYRSNPELFFSKNMIKLEFNMELANISSTYIREALAQSTGDLNNDILKHINHDILKYIQKNNLYL